MKSCVLSHPKKLKVLANMQSVEESLRASLRELDTNKAKIIALTRLQEKMKEESCFTDDEHNKVGGLLNALATRVSHEEELYTQRSKLFYEKIQGLKRSIDIRQNIIDECCRHGEDFASDDVFEIFVETQASLQKQLKKYLGMLDIHE